MRIPAAALLFPPLLCACLALAAAEAAGPRLLSAQGGVEAGGGTVPYEIARAGRREPDGIAIGFDDMQGWTIECIGGVSATLQSTTHEVLWAPDNPTARLTYHAQGARMHVVLRPPAPIPVPGGARAVEMWCYGNNWDWVPDPTTPQVQLTLLLASASGSGAVRRIALARVRWKGWWLVHQRLERTIAEGELLLAGLEVAGEANAEPRTLHFESLRFTDDAMPPLTFEPRPRRPITLFPGQSPGLNTGPGVLPFPTREETILPENIAADFTTTAQWETPGAVFAFRYRGPDGVLTYRIALGDGLPRVKARWGDAPAFDLLAGWHVTTEHGAPAWKQKDAAETDGALRVVLAGRVPGNGEELALTVTLRLWQKSLVWDTILHGGAAAELRFGGSGPFTRAELVPIPFLTYGASNPPVALVWSGTDTGLFLTVWPDWYRSNASEPFAAHTVRTQAQGGTRVEGLGGMRYARKTDGTRNDLFERVFVTVSPVYEEVLPRMPMPVSPHAREAGTRLWQETWGPSDYAQEKARSRRLRAHGIRALTQCNHEITWRDDWESFTLRLEAAPGRGGDAALAAYVAHQKDLGWLSGLYTNYTDFAPINALWDPDLVQRTSDGQLRTAWPRCYALKPSRAVELNRRFAPRIKEKFGPTAAYTDVHTAVAPWHYNDFDHRVPGAGTFAQTIYLYGEILLHDRGVYGPTWSEGSYHWLYPGLASGNYGLCYSGPDLGRFPLLPAFNLREIRSRECVIGMPWTAGFLKDRDWARPENLARSIDRFIAATLAYGHIGWLVEEAHGMRTTCRSYYLLQPVQSAYAQVPPTRIGHGDAQGRLTSVSDALRAGHWRLSRLHVEYGDDLALWVNGGDALWCVEDAPSEAAAPPRPCAGPWLLDTGGFRAKGPTVDAFSGVYAGGRIDYAVGEDVIYADGRGRATSFPFGLRCAGGVAVRRSGAEELEVIDAGGNEWIELGNGAMTRPAAAHILAGPIEIAQARAYTGDGEPLGAVEIRSGDGTSAIRAKERGVRYVLTLKGGTRATPSAPHARPFVPAPGGAAHGLPFVATCVAAGIPLGEGPIAFAIEPCAPLTREVAAAALPPWARLETFPQGVGILTLRATEPEAVPAQGTLLGRAFSVETREHVLIDLLDEDTPRAWYTQLRGGPKQPGDTTTGATCNVDRRACGGVTMRCLFTHPPYVGGVGATIVEFGPFPLGRHKPALSMQLGVADGGDASDGVEFMVYAATKPDAWTHVAKHHILRPGWTPVTVDLTDFAGDRLSLRLVADVGPADNSAADWACWGTPRLIALEPERVLRFQP